MSVTHLGYNPSLAFFPLLATGCNLAEQVSIRVNQTDLLEQQSVNYARRGQDCKTCTRKGSRQFLRQLEEETGKIKKTTKRWLSGVSIHLAHLDFSYTS